MFEKITITQVCFILASVGVPQGSCLGPLLYLMYANDLNYLIPDISSIMFADDTTLIDKNVNLKLLIFMMNTYLAKFYDWCNYNKLAINVKKTKWMLFSNRKTDVPPLMLDAAEIERVKKFKYLGFLIDDRLTHRFHVVFDFKLSAICLCILENKTVLECGISQNILLRVGAFPGVLWSVSVGWGLP